jgi:hypothetical protein
VTSRDTEAARARAEARFKKTEESRAAAASAMADLEAAKAQELAKTARLRALRLEKEAADRLSAPAPKKRGRAVRDQAT